MHSSFTPQCPILPHTHTHTQHMTTSTINYYLNAISYISLLSLPFRPLFGWPILLHPKWVWVPVHACLSVIYSLHVFVAMFSIFISGAIKTKFHGKNMVFILSANLFFFFFFLSFFFSSRREKYCS